MGQHVIRNPEQNKCVFVCCKLANLYTERCFVIHKPAVSLNYISMKILTFPLDIKTYYKFVNTSNKCPVCFHTDGL